MIFHVKALTGENALVKLPVGMVLQGMEFCILVDVNKRAEPRRMIACAIR